MIPVERAGALRPNGIGRQRANGPLMDDQLTDRKSGYRMSPTFKLILLLIFVPLALICIGDMLVMWFLSHR